ncbi:hypothetical protein PSN45_003624 [Yamadazyma tenuis]|uniref:uncharacterized protein n=1 Tax=Candida tenuis TaxID=2315449 RepID=UPI0027A65447|nr:hypothetical protein PSN45_003624 [Yamadazyma tenuis]
MPEAQKILYFQACAVAAAIANQLTFLKSDNPINFDLEHIDIDRLIQESVRARNLINYRALPSVDNILISFFQYIYYVNVEGYMDSGLLCMKEAIDIAQIFRMRHWRMKQGHSTLEMHSLSKIHYMLLISERYMCIEQNLPVCLESSLPLPTSDLDENPSLLAGFQELVKCFALVDRSFFDNLISYTTKQTNYLSASHSNWFPRRSWIKTINSKLKDIQIVHACGETQMMNVTLSKHWMRALVWNLSHENNFTTDVQPEHYLSYKHPVSIARDFLDETSSLSSFAFESNGPGLCVKLLEITCRVADSITITGDLGALPVLQTMFDLVLQYKSDITISRSIYLKVKSVLQKASSSFNEFPAFNLDLFDLQIPSIVSSPYSNLAMSRKEEQSETLHNH